MKLIYNILFVLILQTGWTVKGQDSLVAYWNFDKIDGNTIYDLSVNANHGTNYGCKFVDGVKGNAISFNGTDYIRIPEDGKPPPSIFSGLGKGTISFWFKAYSIPTVYGIAPLFYYGAEEKCDFFDAANKGFIIELGHSPIFLGSKELFFTAWKNGCTYPSFCFDSHDPISTNEWHHIVVVVGENYNTGYLDGVEMKNRDYNFGNASFSQFFEDAIAHEKMWLGKGHWDQTIQYFNGAMDELRIFSKALSPSEVKILYRDTDMVTSISGNKNEKRVNIYPNPGLGTFYYQINDTANTLIDIKIIDSKGKVVLHISNPPAKGKLDTGNLTPGTYSVGFYGKGFSQSKKIIVQKN